MTKHSEYARDLFLQGYNCAQAVMCAFCDVTKMDIDDAARAASSFGGGLGRLREVCGGVSSAALILGIVKGYSDPKDTDAKKQHYRLVRELADRFQSENGSIICRELLRGINVESGGDPEERTAEYYRTRPCPSLVWSAARILDEMLSPEDGSPI